MNFFLNNNAAVMEKTEGGGSDGFQDRQTSALAPSLRVEGIKKSYGNLKVLEDVSLELNPKEFVSVLGPSGCGKSTLFHIIAGLDLPDAGHIFVEEDEVTGRTGRVSYHQQKDLLLPWKRTIDNAALPLRISGVSRRRARERARELFPVFGLEGFEQSYPSELSGGMRQRAALLRTYLFSRRIVLLDEPFGALDAITRGQMHEWLCSVLRDLEPAALLVTHDIDEAILLSDRIYILSPRPASVMGDVDLPGRRGIHRREALESGELRGIKDRITRLLSQGDNDGKNSAL
ncbi:MAG: ABC transporter ATP-binding protein [Spirochaetales bacterium]|nr:ABC transporter ATP-binding protein [Spirochaetales bacterium]MCF7938532.1 ABC transporter ATP-binding protein [Spirochaetales bacterium]